MERSDPELLSQNDYTYNNAGERTANAITTLDSSGSPVTRTESYGYDALNRLTSVNYGDGQHQGYSFDAMGNRTAKTDDVHGNESYAFDNANRLTGHTFGSSSHSYTNDANGNTLTGGGRTNTWDSQNRLVQCATSSNTSDFTYGTDGLHGWSAPPQSGDRFGRGADPDRLCA